MSNKKKSTGPKYLTWTTVCFMTVACVASIRNTPSMAIYGKAAIFLYLVPAILFLIPTALVSAELASGWKGGIYKWVEEGVGPKSGFLAIWSQYAMTLTYYPSLLASVAATLAFVFMPSLATSGVFTAIVILVVYWVATMVSFRGLKASAVISSGGMVIGTLVPGITLVVLGIIYLCTGAHSQSAATSWLPPFTGLASIVLIVNNFLSYAGMEVNAIHVNEMEKPSKEFPKAMFVASGMAVAIFVLPALAISFVVPAKQISLTAGVMQAFQVFFNYFHIGWLTPIFGIMIVGAMVGGMMGWLAGPSKGLLMVGREQGFLPKTLQKTNKNGIQSSILLWQGGLISLIALLYAFIPSVNSAYWILSAMTTQIYMIMYVLMFISVMRLRKKQPDHPRGYKVPALMVVATVGLVTSIVVFCIGLIPPSQFGNSNAGLYVLLMLGGTLLIGLGVPALFLALRKPSWIGEAEVEGALAAGPEEEELETGQAAASQAGAEVTPPVVTAVEPTAERELATAGKPTAEQELATAAKPVAEEKLPRPPRWRMERNTVLGWVVAIVVLALICTVGVIVFKAPKRNAESKAKAQELYDQATAAGIKFPDEEKAVDIFERIYGVDGGASVETATSNLSQAQMLFDTGRASGEVSQRPGPIDTELLKFQYVLLGVYAPEKQAEYQDFVRGLKDQETIQESPGE